MDIGNSMHDLVIRGGTVVTPETTAELDVGVRDGTVTDLSVPGSLPDGETTVDATGRYVLPGLVDAHVHVGVELGEFTTLDDFRAATRAAVVGGTTTVVPFAIPDPDETPLVAFERRRDAAGGEVYADYALHGCVTDASDETLAQLPTLVERGAASVKAFMVYADRLKLTHGELRDVMGAVADAGGLLLVHAEDDEVISRLVDEHVARGECDFSAHPDTHPPVSETTAMWTVAELVAETACPTYVVHVSTAGARAVLASARERDLPLLAETCPHYLSLAREVYDRPDGERFVCSPPIRAGEHADALWELLRDGLVQTVNSDHCCYDAAQKARHRDDVTRMPNGLPGVETRNAVLYADAVATGRRSIEAFVALTSTNAAKMLGLYPRKGAVAVGADADLVVFDPDDERTLRAADLHMATDYTPFEGHQLRGGPVVTVVGGDVVVHDGELVGEPTGSFVPTDGSSAPETFASGLGGGFGA